jgi:hypothetical protein
MLPHYRIFGDIHPDIDIDISCSNTLLHEKLEVSCAQLNLLNIATTKSKVVTIVEDQTAATATNSMMLPPMMGSTTASMALPGGDNIQTTSAVIGTGSVTARSSDPATSTASAAVDVPTLALEGGSTTAPPSTPAQASATAPPIEDVPPVRIGQFAVYLGSAQGPILRYEIEVPLTK